MSRELYNYKRKATTAAKDLWYGDDVLAAIDHATTVNNVYMRRQKRHGY